MVIKFSDVAPAPIMTIIGAGAYGTAIAVALSRNGYSVFLWGHNSDHVKKIKTERCNQAYLPNIVFPSTLHIEESLPEALKYCKNLLIAVPSRAITCILTKLKIYLRDNIRIIVASKGLEPKTGRLLQDVVLGVLGNRVTVAVISGPTFARELAIGLPTAVTLSSTDLAFSIDIQNLLNCDEKIRVYRNSDVIGVQIAGAVKNVIAIGVGISDGIGFGSNARTALITRGLYEMSRLGIAIGAKSNVFMGLAGLGDLVLTCTDDQSRNRRFGILLGQGVTILQAKQHIGKTIEGLYNVKEIYMLSIKYGVDMPITEQVYQILYSNKSVHEAARSLLQRQQKEEYIDFV